jgi:hypothetical protein
VAYLQTLAPELSLIGLADAGIPNKERIILRPTQATALNIYALSIGMFDPTTGGARPLFDHIFWFPEKIVYPPSWIMVFTGPGEPREVTHDGEHVHTFFWSKPTVVFSDARLVPVLVRMGGAIIGPRL